MDPFWQNVPQTMLYGWQPELCGKYLQIGRDCATFIKEHIIRYEQRDNDI